MNIVKLYKYQMLLYLFIVAFGVQNYLFGKYNFSLGFYEQIVTIVFGLSFVTVLASVVVLITQSVVVFKRKTIVKKEMLYLVSNIICYYAVIWTSMYLSTQTRF